MEEGNPLSLQNAILGLLTYKPMTGYDLKQVFDKSINYFWSAHLSQIYRELTTLENKNCVTSQIELQEGKPDRKLYSITTTGKKKFRDWLMKFPTVLSTPNRDEFMVRVFFASRIPPQELKFQLQRFLKEQQELLAAYSIVDEIIKHTHDEMQELTGERFYWQMTLKRGLGIAEANIRWAEECLQELEKK
jgi:DNA-binding PadR family transcriptional regulator